MSYDQLVKPEEFEKCVEAGIESVPEEFRELLENIIIVIQDEPSPEQREIMRLEGDETLLGLYEGISRNRRDSSYSGVLPDQITLFRKPILDAAHSADEIPEIVRDTVWHEIAHYFGMDEEEVERAENERARLKKN